MNMTRVNQTIVSLASLIAFALITVRGEINAQELPLVAVTEFATTYERGGGTQTRSRPENFEVMVETQLLKVGRFRVFERNKLDEILAEQGLQRAIGFEQRDIAIEGVDYLIYGSITDFTIETEEFNTGSVSTFKVTTRFGVDVKIADASTGEIRRAETITVVTEDGSGIRTRDFSQADLNSSGLVDAQRKVAKLVTALLAESIFPIRVVDVDQGEVYINYGDSILSVGDTVRVMREGRELIDPETGRRLGSTENIISTARITETTGEFSKAEIISGEAPTTGDIVRVNTAEASGATAQREARGRRI